MDFNDQLVAAIDNAQSEGLKSGEVIGALVALAVKEAVRLGKKPEQIHKLVDYAFALLGQLQPAPSSTSATNIN